MPLLGIGVIWPTTKVCRVGVLFITATVGDAAGFAAAAIPGLAAGLPDLETALSAAARSEEDDEVSASPIPRSTSATAGSPKRARRGRVLKLFQMR
jgi:hypothetical protein